MGRKRRETQIANLQAFTRNYSDLSELYVSTKEIVNLPDTAYAPWIFRLLRDEGKFVLINDPDLGVISLQLAYEDKWNIYGVVTDGAGIDFFGKTYNFNASNGTVVYANYGFTMREHIAPILMIEEYARRLAAIERTLDINVYAMRTPIMLNAESDKQIETLKSIFRDYDGMMPVLFADSKMKELTKMQAIDLLTKDYTRPLWDLKMNVMNEALTRLGIPNSAVEKRERVNVQEVISNNAGAIAFRQSPLKAIQLGLDDFNKKAGTDMHIEFTDNTESYIDGYNEKKREFDELVQNTLNGGNNDGTDNG